MHSQPGFARCARPPSGRKRILHLCVCVCVCVLKYRCVLKRFVQCCSAGIYMTCNNDNTQCIIITKRKYTVGSDIIRNNALLHW